jgi:hypothetical protein
MMDSTSSKQQRHPLFQPAAAAESPAIARWRWRLVRRVRGLLNKITLATFHPLSDQFIVYGVHTDRLLLTHVVGLVFEKAVDEPLYAPLYARLCHKQRDHELLLDTVTPAVRRFIFRI